MTSTPLSDPLLRELTERRDVLRTLVDASRAQLQLIEAEEFDSLWQAQLRKGPVVARLGAGAPAETSLRAAWESRRDAMPPDLRRRCERLIDESAALLETLLEEERICRTALEDKMVSTRQQLAGTMRAVRTRRQRRDAEQGGTKRTLDVET